MEKRSSTRRPLILACSNQLHLLSKAILYSTENRELSIVIDVVSLWKLLNKQPIGTDPSRPQRGRENVSSLSRSLIDHASWGSVERLLSKYSVWLDITLRLTTFTVAMWCTTTVSGNGLSNHWFVKIEMFVLSIKRIYYHRGRERGNIYFLFPRISIWENGYIS